MFSFSLLFKGDTTYVLGVEAKVRSLCPMLGQTYPILVEGFCPTHLQSPRNKVLPISYIGDPPFIRFDSFTGQSGGLTGGSDFLVIKVLAQKFSFTPKFRFGEYYSHITTEDGDWLGMVAQVCRVVDLVPYTRMNALYIYIRYQKRKLSWELAKHLLHSFPVIMLIFCRLCT